MAEDVPPPMPPPPPPPMVAIAELGLATLVPVEMVAHVGISAEFGLAGSIENRAADEVGVAPEAAAVLP